MEADYGDNPIATPQQDMFGIDRFVQSLARSVRTMRSPNGVVIALNGPWGSGKSSAINLLKHHLSDATSAGEMEIVDFNPWWFRGEEALVLAFFREFYAATKPSLGDKARKILPKLGARLLKAGGAVAPIADAAGASGAGAIASGVMGWLGGMIEDGESVEKLHAALGAALADQPRRFVVMVDDIDRLAPDEALAMFRLVKSVGRLPNVIYILSFDRELAEKVVAERFPSEGPHYLEKIVQVAFELPAPMESDVHRILLVNIEAITGGFDQNRLVHLMNMFHSGVAPEIRTSRDATRYANALSITWPAVEGEVDLGDFIAIEALRMFQPAIYRAIRDNQTLVCEATRDRFGRGEGPGRLDAILLPGIADRDRYRDLLVRLFPRLDSIWGNSIHGGDSSDKDRRIASAYHFQTYFRMSVDPDAVSASDLARVLGSPSDGEQVTNLLREAANERRRDGTTMAKAWLEALVAHGAEIPVDAAEPFLRGAFAAAAEVNVEADEARGWAIGDNLLRMHWLLRRVLMNRTTVEERSRILLAAVRDAPLAWLGSLTASAWEQRHRTNAGKEPKAEDECLHTDAGTEALRDMFLERITTAAADGSLIRTVGIARLLHLWRAFLGDDAPLREWMRARLEEDASLVALAREFTTHSWSQSSGDLVSVRSDRAAVADLERLTDPESFRAKLVELEGRLAQESEEAKTIGRLLRAWEHRGEHGDW